MWGLNAVFFSLLGEGLWEGVPVVVWGADWRNDWRRCAHDAYAAAAVLQHEQELGVLRQ